MERWCFTEEILKTDFIRELLPTLTQGIRAAWVLYNALIENSSHGNFAVHGLQTMKLQKKPGSEPLFPKRLVRQPCLRDGETWRVPLISRSPGVRLQPVARILGEIELSLQMERNLWKSDGLRLSQSQKKKDAVDANSEGGFVGEPADCNGSKPSGPTKTTMRR